MRDYVDARRDGELEDWCLQRLEQQLEAAIVPFDASSGAV
jgi:hypothetical protein